MKKNCDNCGDDSGEVPTVIPCPCCRPKKFAAHQRKLDCHRELVVKVGQLATLLRLIQKNESMECFALEELEADTWAVLRKATGKK